MARQGVVQNYHDFSTGIITEGNALSSNEAVVRWAVNMRFRTDGSAVKRGGLGKEPQVADPRLTPILNGLSGGAPGQVKSYDIFQFEAVQAEDYTGGLAVIRHAQDLWVVELTGADLTPSTHPISNLTDSTVDGVDTPIDMIQIQNRVLVLQPNSVRWIYKEGADWKISDSVVSQTDPHKYAGAMVRDFSGVPDGFALDDEPGILTPDHKYNLLNQGWDEDKMLEFFSSADTDGWPSNAQVWHEGRDEDDNFDPAALKKVNFGGSPAAKGRAIINAITLDRDGVFPGVTPSLSSTVTVGPTAGLMYTTGTAFSGRAAFSGINSPNAANKIFVSPIIDGLRPNFTFSLITNQVVTPGIMVAVGHGGIQWSEDGGDSWTDASIQSGPIPTTGHDWKAVIWHPTLRFFLAYNNDGNATVSLDGKTWGPIRPDSSSGDPSPTNTDAVVCCDTVNDRFVWLRSNGEIRTSTNGLTWALTGNFPNTEGFRIRFSKLENKFFALAGGTEATRGLWESSALNSWTRTLSADVDSMHTVEVGRDGEEAIAVARIKSGGGMGTGVNTLRVYRRDTVNGTWVSLGYTAPGFGNDAHRRWSTAALGLSSQSRWLLVSPDNKNPNDRRVLTVNTGVAGSMDRPSVPGFEWRTVTWNGEFNRWVLGAHNSAQVYVTTNGTTFSAGGVTNDGIWGLAVKPPETIESTVTDISENFFDSIFRFYQRNDPTAEISNDLLADDGLVIDILEADRITKLETLSNALLAGGPNGWWAITGPDIQSGFRTDDYMQYRVTNIGCRYPRSVVQAGDRIYYWADSGIYALALGEAGRFVVASVTDNRLESFYDELPTSIRERVSGYYDSYNDYVYWIMRDKDAQYGTASERNAILALNQKTGAFEYHLMSNTADQAPGIMGFIQDPLSENPNVPKWVVQQWNPSLPSGGVSFSFLQESPSVFYDWHDVPSVPGSPRPYDAYLETWPDTLDSPNRSKDAMWVYVYMNKTESGFIQTDDGLQPVHPSSVFMTAKWDWHLSEKGNRWGRPRQMYRHRRPYIPADANDTFDTGESIIETKGKAYGRGKALSLRFSSEPGFDMQLRGFSIPYTVEDET